MTGRSERGRTTMGVQTQNPLPERERRRSTLDSPADTSRPCPGTHSSGRPSRFHFALNTPFSLEGRASWTQTLCVDYVVKHSVSHKRPVFTPTVPEEGTQGYCSAPQLAKCPAGETTCSDLGADTRSACVPGGVLRTA